jgi:hypothetical protein
MKMKNFTQLARKPWMSPFPGLRVTFSSFRLAACILGAIVLFFARVGTAEPILNGVVALYQNDNRWANTNIDSSQSTIGNFGCTLTAYTMFINYAIAQANLVDKNGQPISYTPAQVNTLLNNYRWDDKGTTKNGWDLKVGDPAASTTELTMNLLSDAVKANIASNSQNGQGLILAPTDSDFHTWGWRTPQSPAPSLAITDMYQPFLDALNAKDPIVVRVNNDQHTVLVTGRDNQGNWIIADPANKDNTTLKVYNNTICGYDWMVTKAGAAEDTSYVPDDVIRANDAVAVPEPATLLLFGLGGLAMLRRRR